MRRSWTSLAAWTAVFWVWIGTDFQSSRRSKSKIKHANQRSQHGDTNEFDHVAEIWSKTRYCFRWELGLWRRKGLGKGPCRFITGKGMEAASNEWSRREEWATTAKPSWLQLSPAAEAEDYPFKREWVGEKVGEMVADKLRIPRAKSCIQLAVTAIRRWATKHRRWGRSLSSRQTGFVLSSFHCHRLLTSLDSCVLLSMTAHPSVQIPLATVPDWL